MHRQSPSALRARRGGKRAQLYEAGRDALWLHRWLIEQGIDNLVVDSSSIDVNRRARRAKTDRLDGNKLLAMLIQIWSDPDDTASRTARSTPSAMRRGRSPMVWIDSPVALGSTSMTLAPRVA